MAPRKSTLLRDFADLVLLVAGIVMILTAATLVGSAMLKGVSGVLVKAPQQSCVEEVDTSGASPPSDGGNR